MDEALQQDVARLLSRAGLPAACRATRLFGGNNRIYRLSCGGRDVVLKVYFQHPEDKRPRLTREFSFIRFAWNQGLRCLPEPLATDPACNMALYGYVPGRKLAPAEVGDRAIGAALDFIAALYRLQNHPGAAGLLAASEACYSVLDHIRVVDHRLARLAAIDPRLPLHQEALSFLRGPLSGCWEKAKRSIAARARSAGIDLAAGIAPGDRCLSPSDFGFHNALLIENGDFAFLDFEYAGWDDPAKMVGDFFNQVAVPVPAGYYARFADAVAAFARDPASQRRRFDLLFPVYQAKWVCIVLNDFLPAGNTRRDFSGEEAAELRKANKLRMADQMLRRINLDR